jgi:hypothetical protein
MDEMKQNFETERDKEFMSHICIKQPGTKVQKDTLPKKPE